MSSVDPVLDVDKAEDGGTDTSEHPSNEAGIEASALKQVEFYLSDANLPYDKFMWTLYTKNSDHWIPIATLASFKRMAEFKPYGSEWLVNVLQRSDGLIEVDPAGVNVRRIPPIVPPSGAEHLDCSIYAKGFDKETPGMQKELEIFFEKWGPVNAVRMRRLQGAGHSFKGSVFCEFKDRASAEAFLNAVPKPKWGDEELLIMSKDEYIIKKSKEKGFAIPDRTKFTPGSKGRSFNAFILMEQEARAAKKDTSEYVHEDLAEEGKPMVKVPLEIIVDGTKIVLADDGSFNEEDLKYTKGKVLKFTGDYGSRVPVLEIKESLAGVFDKKPFVEVSGVAAFPGVVSDEQLVSIREKASMVDGKAVTWSHPTEEEERRFWVNRAKFFASQAKEGAIAKHSGTNPGRGTRGGRGGRRGDSRGGRRGRGGKHSGDGGNKKRKRDEESTGETSKRSGEVPSVSVSSKKPRVDGETES